MTVRHHLGTRVRHQSESAVGDRDRYRLRWFTPTVEVPLCGHATLASAAVVMERLSPELQSGTIDTASGPLVVSRAGSGFVMNFPARPMLPAPTPDRIIAAVGRTPVETFVDGFNYLVLLQTAEDVRTLVPDFTAIADLERDGLIVTAPGFGDYDCVSRYFAPLKGIPEDPVTGGAHCALAP
jgi:predicted PhzF superfamily epimerase YddE/YHI9